MKNLILILTAATMIFFISGCSKEKEATPGTSNATIAFSIDLLMAENLKNSGILENWKHPIDVIIIEMTNQDNGDIFIEEFASKDAMIVVVPRGVYHTRVSTVKQEKCSDYLQFSTEKVINVHTSMNVSMKAEKLQCLFTVSNSEIVPEVDDNQIFYKSGVYFAYLTEWDGKWKYGDKVLSTSEAPIPGKMYNFIVKPDGTIEEGIEDWNEDYESLLDQIVQSEFYDISNTNGFLVTADPAGGAVWKKSRLDQQASHEMTATISHLLFLSGYKEVSKLGFEANWHYVDQGNELTGASLYGLMGGYQATSNAKYKTLGQKIFPEIMKRFSPTGTNPPRTEKWGYDYINYLEGANKAVKYDLKGALAYYEALTADYLANYERVAKDDYQRLYINAIYDRLGIGSYQGVVDWDHSYSLQDVAAGLMGNSWENPNNVKKYLINDLLKNAENSEDLAEAIYALSL